MSTSTSLKSGPTKSRSKMSSSSQKLASINSTSQSGSRSTARLDTQIPHVDFGGGIDEYASKLITDTLPAKPKNNRQKAKHANKMKGAWDGDLTQWQTTLKGGLKFQHGDSTVVEEERVLATERHNVVRLNQQLTFNINKLHETVSILSFPSFPSFASFGPGSVP